MKTDRNMDRGFYLTGWILIAAVSAYAGITKLTGIHFLSYYPPCAFRLITGFYCPGCGGTRAVIALFHGHILRSVFYHPIVVYTAGFGGWFMLSQTIEKASRGRFAIGMHYRDLYLWIALFLVVVNCLIKNLVLAIGGIALLG